MEGVRRFAQQQVGCGTASASSMHSCLIYSIQVGGIINSSQCQLALSLLDQQMQSDIPSSLPHTQYIHRQRRRVSHAMAGGLTILFAYRQSRVSLQCDQLLSGDPASLLNSQQQSRLPSLYHTKFNNLIRTSPTPSTGLLAAQKQRMSTRVLR